MTEVDTSNWSDLSQQPDHRTNNPLSYHPYANIFPLMLGKEFSELVADIKANGLEQPITVDGRNQVIDGRNRHRACLEAGVEPTFETFAGDDVLRFIISRNLHRRHLDESQRGMVAGRIATLKHGQHQDASIEASASQNEAAEQMNVGRSTVQRARQVLDKGTPELVAAVDAGQIPVSVAAKLATASPAVQARAVAEPERAHTIEKQARRQDRVEDLAERTEQASAELGAQVYSVISADPPWRFQPYSRLTGMDRSADNHYPTMTINDLLAMKPPAAKDCVLFLWATAPMLPQALDVMKAWGFTYKSHAIWAKDKIGTGYWFRNKHELLLVGTKGDIPAPAPGTQADSLIEAPVGKHSEKPEAFFNMVEVYFPTLSRLEMFARGEPREGWDQWGNEAPQPMIFGEQEEGIEIPEHDAPEEAPAFDWSPIPT